MKGLPLNLNMYDAFETLTNKHFREFKMSEFERIYLPDSIEPFTDLISKGTKEFVVDDNRGAVSTSPCLEIDGTDFYLSVKGIGSTRSEEHTSELQSLTNLVCRLLLEKKKHK